MSSSSILIASNLCNTELNFSEFFDILSKEFFNFNKLEINPIFSSEIICEPKLNSLEISSKFDCPVMIHSWPHETKAFYMKRDDSDKLALGVDVIAPEGYGEIVGGGQREDDHDTLVKRIEDHGLPLSAFKWYLDLRKYGSVTHSGFGLGLERTVSWICGIDHVRQTIPFPRTMGRLEP